MNIARFLLKLFGWELTFTVPDFPKCIICVAPHTSNWDFILGELAIHAVGRTAGFLMKSSWFFFPLGYVFKALGGVPVNRGEKKGSLVQDLVARYNAQERLVIAITPEGTRKKVSNWHTGFLQIAYQAGVPVVLGAINGASRRIIVSEVLMPSGNVDNDLHLVKQYYKQFTGIKPENFTT